MFALSKALRSQSPLGNFCSRISRLVAQYILYQLAAARHMCWQTKSHQFSSALLDSVVSEFLRSSPPTSSAGKMVWSCPLLEIIEISLKQRRRRRWLRSHWTGASDNLSTQRHSRQPFGGHPGSLNSIPPFSFSLPCSLACQCTLNDKQGWVKVFARFNVVLLCCG